MKQDHRLQRIDAVVGKIGGRRACLRKMDVEAQRPLPPRSVASFNEARNHVRQIEAAQAFDEIEVAFVIESC